jgi:RNA polymerase sigma-70 factor, ECF subfamily
VKTDNLDAHDEQRLIEASRAGSTEAFSKLIHIHQAAVRAYVAHFIRRWDCVDDLAQETFLGAYRSLPTFRGESPLRFWLLGIARRQVLAFLRADFDRQRNKPRIERELTALMIETVQADTLGPGEFERRMNMLSSCIKALPPHNVQIFEGFYRENRSIADLASVFHRSQGAIKLALYRIRQSLRSCIEKQSQGITEEGVV